MIILVDFENVHAAGMDGYEYLNSNDTLVVYYSDENSAITRGVVDDLTREKVNVRMVKLLKQHSNALDMYIASTTGMYLDIGEKICIVSKDKGYAAVRDFWHSLRGAEILLGETIEECFLHSVSNDEERIRLCKERHQKALLVEAFETMNRVPTRPTLSQRNPRRGRRENLDTSKNLDPVQILPDPLKPHTEGAEGSEEREENTIELVEQYLQLENREAESGASEEMVPAAGEESAKQHQGTRDSRHPGGRSGYRGQRRETAIKVNPNEQKFIYDPVSRTMLPVGADGKILRESSAAEAAVKAGEQESLKEESPEKKKWTRRRRRTLVKPETAEEKTEDIPSEEVRTEEMPSVSSENKKEEKPEKEKRVTRRRRTVPKKTGESTEKEKTVGNAAAEKKEAEKLSDKTEEKPKRRVGRPRKTEVKPETKASEKMKEKTSAEASVGEEGKDAPKKRTTRRRRSGKAQKESDKK